MNVALGVLQVRSVIFLASWTFFEFTSGQSLGKKVMNLKVIDMNAKVPTLAKAFLRALGKVFILVLDVSVGWIFLNENGQKLLVELTDTLVIKVKPLRSSGVKVVKEEE